MSHLDPTIKDDTNVTSMNVLSALWSVHERLFLFPLSRRLFIAAFCCPVMTRIRQYITRKNKKIKTNEHEPSTTMVRSSRLISYLHVLSVPFPSGSKTKIVVVKIRLKHHENRIAVRERHVVTVFAYFRGYSITKYLSILIKNKDIIDAEDLKTCATLAI